MTRVKICGITSARDVEIVSRFKPDMMGVIVEVDVSTPREIDVSLAGQLLRYGPSGPEKVAVTMPRNFEDVINLADRLDVDYFQIHSELSLTELEGIGESVDEGIIGVSTISPEVSEMEDIMRDVEKKSEIIDLLLLDTESDIGGGTGTVHDWEVSSEIVDILDIPVILAGGLDPSNVKEAVDRVEPYAVDVASGVESEPGEKDPRLVNEFIREGGG